MNIIVHGGLVQQVTFKDKNLTGKTVVVKDFDIEGCPDEEVQKRGYFLKKMEIEFFRGNHETKI